MKNKFGLVLALLMTTGCSEKIVYLTGPSKTKTDTIVVTVGMQTVNLRIDWNKLQQSSASKLTEETYAMSDSGLAITHIGSRLVYLKDNASFTQSVKKDTGNTSLITMQVPSTDSASLYVVAVYQLNGVRKALKMGVKKNFRISVNTPINLTLDSLTLIDTDWSLVDTTLTIVDDTIRLTASSTVNNKILNVRATDPYQVNEKLPHSNTIVKFYGSGFEYGNVNGWQKYGIIVLNNLTTATIDTFWPYVDGSLFNLNGDYLIGKQGIIKTTWQ